MNERTFHVLVVAPLRASADHAMNPPWEAPVRFERATFDEAMATAAPALAIDVPDPKAPSAKKGIRLELAFPAMRAFRPDVLVAEVPWLRELAAEKQSAPGPNAASLVDDILSGMGSAPEGGGANAALASVVAHPEVRSLERAWRGLHFLVSRCDRDAVIVEAIDAQAEDVDAALERVARRTDGALIDLVIVDHALGSSRRDLDRLETWAQRAESLGAPLVANALPELLGLDDLTALGRTQRRLRSSDDPRASALRNVAARDVTRWIGLALNGALARPRHSGPVPRTNDVTLEEKSELHLGAAHMVGALAASSFARTGWPCALAGPNHGVIGELPVHTIEGTGTPLEALASEEAAAEVAAAGVMMFASVANKDVAILAHAPVLHRGAPPSGGASPAAAHGLVDQLFIARLAQAVVQLASAIPGDTPEAAVRDVVQLALADLFGDAPRKPEVVIAVTGAPPCLEVTVRPRGFHGVRLEEATLGAPLS